jgi:hypothetical protein
MTCRLDPTHSGQRINPASEWRFFESVFAFFMRGAGSSERTKKPRPEGRGDVFFQFVSVAVA